jgi:drug/metabolite transporter (DMT)-like permease
MSSNKGQKKTYVLLASMVFFSSFGNVLLSRGMKQTGEIINFSPAALAATFLKTFANVSIWLGILSLLIFFVSYLLLLSWADFSYVQPASAIGYALVAVLGYFALGEFVSPIRWLGVLIICLGVALVGASPSGRGRRGSQLAGAPGEGIGSRQILRPSPSLEASPSSEAARYRACASRRARASRPLPEGEGE